MNRWLVVVGVVAGCSKAPSYTSNFAKVKIDASTHSVVGADGKPYAGTLIARDKEIIEVARGVLGEPALEHVAGTDVTGLVLIMKIENGAPTGTAQVLVDLNAPKLNAEVERYSGEALALARAASPTIKVAEATFKAGKLDGPAIAYAPAPETGTLVKVAEAQLVDDKLHGKAIEYHPGTTKISREYSFENGKRVGVQKELYANGAKRAEITLSATGELIGHKRWYPNGKPELDIVYEGGELKSTTQWYSNGVDKTNPPEGVLEEFYASGNVRTRTTYAGGVKHGAFEQLYSSGKKWKVGTYDRDQLHGHYQEWWKNGKPATDATYDHGVLVGTYKRWYANGKDWESATYVAGKRDGAYRKWWKNGKPAHVYTYKAGKLDGDYRQFYDNGATWAVARYDNGKPQGKIERWFPDGKLGYVMNHENGRPHGEYKRWYADGKPRLEATYVKGRFDGELKNWREDGSVYEMATYNNGLLVSSSRQP